jgi:hypothetical protein
MLESAALRLHLHSHPERSEATVLGIKWGALSNPPSIRG